MLNRRQFRRPVHFILRAASFALLTGLWVSPPIGAIAQEYVPPVEGLPGRRQGGGTRGDCLRSEIPLIALMPNSNFGQTLEAYPTFYWYVPAISAEAAEFVLLDPQGNEVYVAEYRLANQPGIVSISLPQNAGLPPLAVGENYHWYFSLICDPLDRSGDVSTEGWVRRVDDRALVQEATALSDLDRARLYAESSIWYEALDILAQLRRLQPADPAIEASWETLLNSVGLEHLSDAGFVEVTEEDAEF